MSATLVDLGRDLGSRIPPVHARVIGGDLAFGDGGPAIWNG